MTGVGALFMYSGLKGKKFSDALRAVIAGQSPTSTTQTNPIGTSGGAVDASTAALINPNPPNSATIAGYKAFAMTLLTAHGWPTQFASFNNIVMAESGWNSRAFNPSGAFGIAQALNHGNAQTRASSGMNAYGNYGTPNAICKAANSGNGNAQLVWMCNYIAQSYGSPDNAWGFHTANGYY